MNIFGYPLYVARMEGHEKYKEQFMPFLEDERYFHSLPEWASSSDTTMGHPLNNDLPWQDITNEAIKHMFSFLEDTFELNQKCMCYADPWLNKYRKGDFQEQHSHANLNVHFSSAYMLLKPSDQNNFVFVDKIQDYYSQIGLGRFCDNIPDKFYMPEQDEGILLIFPSHLDHFVIPNRSDNQRATISMNFRLDF